MFFKRHGAELKRNVTKSMMHIISNLISRFGAVPIVASGIQAGQVDG